MTANIVGPSSIPGLWKLCSSFAESYLTSLPVCHQHSCLLKLMSIQLVMPSNCFLQCGPFLHLLSIFPGTKKSLGYPHSVLRESDQRFPYKMEEEKDMPSSSPGRSPKLQLGAEQLSAGECWIPQKKDTPRPSTKDKPKQDSRRAEILFRVKSHTHQWHLEDSKKTCAQQNLETPQRLSQKYVWVSPVEELGVSSGLPQGQGLWVQECWSRTLRHKPSWKRSPLTTTIEPPNRWPTNCRTIIPKKFSHC